MNIRRWTSMVATAAMAALTGVASAQGNPMMPNDQMNAALNPQVQKPIELTDAQVKGFLDATEEMRTAAKDAQAGSKAEAAGVAQESLAIIKKHGFEDLTEFQRVGYNAAMAYNVLQQGGKETIAKKLDKAEAEQKKTIERLSGQLSPEQLELLKKQAAMALSTARTMQDVPEGNVEIMKKYQDRMTNLGKGD